MVKRPRGRPPRTDWLTTGQLARVPIGAAVVIDTGTHRSTIRGRVEGVMGSEMHLTGDRVVDLDRVRRGRVVNGLFDPDELVVRRGVPEATWRGGVVRCLGREVEVEFFHDPGDGDSVTGFEWVHEDLLEPADLVRSTRARVGLTPPP